MAFDHHIPIGGNLRFKHGILSEASHQDGRTPIDKTLCQAFVQGVGQSIFD
jgi:hypothetical protein